MGSSTVPSMPRRPAAAKSDRQLRRIGQDQVPNVVPRGGRPSAGGQDLLGRVEQGVERSASSASARSLWRSGRKGRRRRRRRPPGLGRGRDVKFGRFHPAVDQQQIVALERAGSLTGQVGFRPIGVGQVGRHETGHVARPAWRSASRPARPCRNAARRSAGSRPAGRN